MKRKVMCVFGTRSETIKIVPIVRALSKSEFLTPLVVLTGQHREILDQMISCFQIEPACDLNLTRPEASLAEYTALLVTGLDDLFNEFTPDLTLVLGDTLTAMAAAWVAHFHKVPVAHVEAGLRTNDRYNPFAEEMYRVQTSQLATLHFAPTQQAVENLRRESITEHVHLTGNTIVDALMEAVEQTKTYPVDQKKCFDEVDFTKYRVLIATMHRRENRGPEASNIARALRQIVDEFPDTQILYPKHKNPVLYKVIESTLEGHPRIILIEPVEYLEFIWAMQRCFFILTDSGGIQEEAPMLGKPVLVLRETTERQEAVKSGNLELVGSNREKIVRSARKLLTDQQTYNQRIHSITAFGDGKATKRIVRVLEDYFGG
ncbi:MAG: UDP-N-acetylglucosamine 2-epimerase (non-hydrolyzing) [Candidatus Melainabacteria bacterium]|nr:MAG: UDP-N-acetylglucosamine 2-epimerase (non-hydrolyzing) [Candidatus Melainabacteria bacterium]